MGRPVSVGLISTRIQDCDSDLAGNSEYFLALKPSKCSTNTFICSKLILKWVAIGNGKIIFDKVAFKTYMITL